MSIYRHTVQYYETDQMGIAHHSNFIRWMEEARTEWMRQAGWDYKRLEEEGLLIPVRSVNCVYKQPFRYEDEVVIESKVIRFNGFHLKIEYEMKNRAGEVCALAQSEHTFVDKNFQLVRVSRKYPELAELFAPQEE